MATGRGSCFLSICSSTFCFYRPSSGLTNENVLLYLSFGRLSCNKCQIVLTPWLPGLLSVRVADTNSVRSAQCWQKKTKQKRETKNPRELLVVQEVFSLGETDKTILTRMLLEDNGIVKTVWVAWSLLLLGCFPFSEASSHIPPLAGGGRREDQHCGASNMHQVLHLILRIDLWCRLWQIKEQRD